MKNRKILIIIFSMCVSLVLVAFLIFMITSQDNSKNRYTAYKATVKVELVTKDNNHNNYTLKIFDDGKNAIANLSFSNSTIYMTKDKFIYSYDGGYRSIENEISYRELYKTIGNIDLGDKVSTNGKEVRYNPKLENETINIILDSINLGKHTKEERNAFMILKDDKIEKFSLYLTELEDYNSCNIVVTFNDLEDNIIEIPKIYKELLNKGFKKDLSIIKDE